MIKYFDTKSEELIKAFESAPAKSIKDKWKEVNEMRKEQAELLKAKQK